MEKSTFLGRKGQTKGCIKDEIIGDWTAIKSEINKLIYDKWTRYWERLNECRQTKIFFPKPNPGFSKKLLKLDRHTLSTCLQWLTGHTFLNRHEFVVGNLDFNECRFCMLEEETSSHLVTNCEVFWQERLPPDKFPPRYRRRNDEYIFTWD